MEYLVDEKVLVNVLNYLQTKPFLEVNALIAGIQTSKKIDNKKEDKLKKK